MGNEDVQHLVLAEVPIFADGVGPKLPVAALAALQFGDVQSVVIGRDEDAVRVGGSLGGTG